MSKATRHATYNAHELRCAYSGRDLLASFEEWVGRVRDHLVARSLGGQDGPANRLPACRTCDRLKRNFPASTVEEARAVIAREGAIELERWQSVRAKFRKGTA